MDVSADGGPGTAGSDRQGYFLFGGWKGWGLCTTPDREATQSESVCVGLSTVPFGRGGHAGCGSGTWVFVMRSPAARRFLYISVSGWETRTPTSYSLLSGFRVGTPRVQVGPPRSQSPSTRVPTRPPTHPRKKHQSSFGLYPGRVREPPVRCSRDVLYSEAVAP